MTTPTEVLANDDMVEGYLDGLKDERKDMPKSFGNRSHSYRHGWLNGRDDRLKKPRDIASCLRLDAAEAIAIDNGDLK